MSSRSNIPVPSGTVVLPDLANEGRDVANLRSRKRSLLAQLESGSAEGGRPTPEELLAQWPTDPTTDRDAASLIFQDFCRRRKEEPRTTLHHYEERFPEHKDSLASLVRRDAFLQSLSGSEGSVPHFALPEVGDRLFGFRLLHELGRGSFARVFLAAQDELASRPVVLKVSNLEGDEPQTMAMLQHTHIVPIHSLHEDRKAGLRAVCMPYFGGASLSAVLKQAGVGSAPVRSGAQLVSALQAVQAPLSAIDADGSRKAMSADPKVLTLLKSYSYPQAAAWVVARLAEGLQHSHDRGVLHRDIKPSNVLLGMDGQPMLLDFNLAQVTRGENVRVVLGGTINYMAPEHLRSLATRDPAIGRQVDHRADIYSLGMVFYEMLVGRGPFAESASYTPLPLLVEAMAVERGRSAPSLRAAVPDAPWNLEAILSKCLAPLPDDRYQQADHLAEDLECFLDDRPLRHAPELSLRERCRKWRRRHPRLATAGSVGLVAVLLVSTLGSALVGSQHLLAVTQSQLGNTQQQLDEASARQRKQAFRAGTIRALCLVNTTTNGQDQLPEGRKECENTLGIYQILECGDWQEQPVWHNLPGSDHRAMAEDVRELLLLLAWANVSANPKDTHTLRKALSLLDRCEAVAGLAPIRALWEDRALYHERLGDAARAKECRLKATSVKPACARDHYLLAISLARSGRYGDAIAELNTALRLNPDHYWSLVQRGICYREQGELLLATGDFSRCAGLEPDFAWGHYNYGCILDQDHKHEQAIAAYDEALSCDENFALAYLNRGLALLDLKRFKECLADLDQASRRGREDALLHLGKGRALEALGQSQQADAAFAQALARLRDLAPRKRASILLPYGFAIYKRLSEQAEGAFARVLAEQPHHPQALYGRAMVLVEAKKESDAIARLDEALLWHPTFMDGRRSRAVLLARQGKLALAQEDINRCLQQEPRSGITLYAAACVLAQAVARNPESDARRQLEAQAVGFLSRAFEQGYGRATAATDQDLRPLHDNQRFKALVRPKTTE